MKQIQHMINTVLAASMSIDEMQINIWFIPIV